MQIRGVNGNPRLKGFGFFIGDSGGRDESFEMMKAE